MAVTKILVVDDEESLRLPLYTAFQSEGFDVSLAADGMEALEILKRGDFQVVLTDLMMPKMDGIELMGQAHVLFPDLVVILMSGYGTIETAIKALKGGAYDSPTIRMIDRTGMRPSPVNIAPTTCAYNRGSVPRQRTTGPAS